MIVQLNIGLYYYPDNRWFRSPINSIIHLNQKVMKKILAISLMSILFTTVGFTIPAGNIWTLENQFQDLTLLPSQIDAISEPPSTVNTLRVTLGPTNCEALQYCTIEIQVLDVNSCSVDNTPIAKQYYTYGDDNIFTDLTIDNGYVKVWVKFVGQCNYTHYEKYTCVAPSSSMHVTIDCCVP